MQWKQEDICEGWYCAFVQPHSGSQIQKRKKRKRMRMRMRMRKRKRMIIEIWKKKIITRFDARGGEAAEKKNCLQFRCFSKFGRLLSNFFVLRLDGAPYGRGVAILLPYVFRYFSYIHSLHHRRPLILIMILTIASLLNRLIELWLIDFYEWSLWDFTEFINSHSFISDYYERTLTFLTRTRRMGNHRNWA